MDALSWPNEGNVQRTSITAIAIRHTSVIQIPLVNRFILRLATVAQRSSWAERLGAPILHQYCGKRKNWFESSLRNRTHTNTHIPLNEQGTSDTKKRTHFTRMGLPDLPPSLFLQNEPDGHPRLCGRDLSTVCTKDPTIVNTARLSNLSRASISLNY